LKKNQVEEWVSLPLWLVDPTHRGMLRADVSRALAAGLELRPLEQTVRDTVAWIRSGAETFVDQGRPKPGLDPDHEAALLAEVLV
jgi:2'-hydroxyisoflavone reductase